MTPIAALQTALAGEHAAVYVYSVLGAQTSKAEQASLYAAVVSAYNDHRTSRDRLIALVTKHGAEPRGSAPAYDLPNDASTPALVRQAAQETETRVALGLGQLVENTSGADRAFAIAALTDAARRVVVFDGEPAPFPGMATRP